MQDKRVYILKEASIYNLPIFFVLGIHNLDLADLYLLIHSSLFSKSHFIKAYKVKGLDWNISKGNKAPTQKFERTNPKIP